jgi:AcrR family transcriptional regulator
MPAKSSPVFPLMVEVPEPGQARSRDALERLLRAGEMLMAENRFDEIGVADLAKLAHTSVGTFYRVLGDKDTLSRVLLQRFFAEMVESIEAVTEMKQWKARPLEEFIRALVSMFVSVYRGREGVLRALITRSSRDAQFRDRVHQLNHLIAQRTLAVLATKAKSMKHPNPGQAMLVVMPVILGILNQHTLTGSLAFLPDPQLEDELVRVALAYLGAGY